MSSDSSRICTTCGHLGEPASHTPGSMRIEAVLWLCLIVPGLIYSLWRLSARREVCGKCGATTLLPLDAPLAQRFMQAHQLQAPTPAGASPTVLSAGSYSLGAAVGKLVGRVLR
jgi:hypothetical protein